MGCVINREKWLQQYFWGSGFYYLSGIYFELLVDGDTTESILGIIFVN